MRTLIIWILLVLQVFTRHGTGHRGTRDCGPQNVILSNENQRLLVSWEDHPSCSSQSDPLIYELVVLIADKQVHSEEVAVGADQIGSSHSWSWTSYLPVMCASHSVRITFRYKNHTGLWTEKTLPGQEPSEEILIFPQDNVFEVGSRATFCCIIPLQNTFRKMSLDNYKETIMNTTKINNYTYALSVDLLWPTLYSDADIKCQTNQSEDGTCATIGYPPSERNLTCETRDLESVECHWTVGKISSISTYYKLLNKSCATEANNKCSQKVEVDSGERNWTLIAQNDLGTIELTDKADLMKRVHMYAPEQVTSEANSRNVNLKWTWSVQQYRLLNLTCQIKLTDRATQNEIKNIGVGLDSSVLNDLIPNWTYNAMVRCATVQHFWKWGDWSKATGFCTKGDIPDALDVWMHKKDQQTVITWKMLEDHQSHGLIIDYEVTWINTAQKPPNKNKISVVHPNHSIVLNLNVSEEYIFKVTARNEDGSSSPSQIIVSRQSQERPKVKVSKVNGTGGGFNLSWSASQAATCGYIVDWCPATGECSVDWFRVPPSNTSASIYSKNFQDGVRYILSIYSCTEGAPMLLERREGYVKEEKIPDGLFQNLRWQQRGSDGEISWDPIYLTEQTAFIQGYVLHCTDGTTVINVTTDNPEATSLTARNLKIASYDFTVRSLTVVGECGSTTLRATLNLPMDNMISVIVISLVTAFTLLLLITIVCYRHWACIKQKIYPPIPKPVLMGKWLTSQGEHCTVPYCHSEEHVMDVPELQSKLAASPDGYICQRYKPFVFTQTPKGYYNQPLQKHIPSELILPSTVISPQMELSSSQFPNPLYSLVMLSSEVQANLETNYHNCTPVGRNSSGYHPQIITKDLDLSQTEQDPHSIMPCTSTYIVLPH